MSDRSVSRRGAWQAGQRGRWRFARGGGRLCAPLAVAQADGCGGAAVVARQHPGPCDCGRPAARNPAGVRCCCARAVRAAAAGNVAGAETAAEIPGARRAACRAAAARRQQGASTTPTSATSSSMASPPHRVSVAQRREIGPAVASAIAESGDAARDEGAAGEHPVETVRPLCRADGRGLARCAGSAAAADPARGGAACACACDVLVVGPGGAAADPAALLGGADAADRHVRRHLPLCRRRTPIRSCARRCR